MEDIFDNCHVFQNIERHVDADEPLTYALDCFQKLLDESYLVRYFEFSMLICLQVKINLKDFKKMIVVIEDILDYYQMLLGRHEMSLLVLIK